MALKVAGVHNKLAVVYCNSISVGLEDDSLVKCLCISVLHSTVATRLVNTRAHIAKARMILI